MSADTLRRRREAFVQWMEIRGLNVQRVAAAAKMSPNTLYSYVDQKGKKPTQALKTAAEAEIAEAYDVPVDAIFGPVIPAREPNHVRAWRERANLTQAELAASVGTTVAILQMLENGEITLSGKWLRRLEEPLGAKGGIIYGYHPDDVAAEALVRFGRIPDKPRALQMLDLLATNTGTGG